MITKVTGTLGSVSTLNVIRAQIQTSIDVKEAVLSDEKLLLQVAGLADTCFRSLREGGKVIFAGNGGSFADAQHLTAEFVTRLQFDRGPLHAVALGTNSSVFSATGNDYSFEEIFARELRAIARPNDVFIPITTSGNSQNILAAAETARELGIRTMGWTGQSGGRLKQICECICIPSVQTARIQEVHILFGHILCCLVESACFPKEHQAWAR